MAFALLLLIKRLYLAEKLAVIWTFPIPQQAKVQCTGNVVFSPSTKSKVQWELEINDLLYGRARFTNTLSFLVLIQNSCRCHAPLNWLYLKERGRIDEREAEIVKRERGN